MTTLLQKALAIRPQRETSKKISNEEIELALAFIEGRITSKQLGIALGYRTNSVCGQAYSLITRVVVKLYCEGKLSWTTERK